MQDHVEVALTPVFTSALMHAPIMNNKYLVMEIKAGDMKMNEYTFQNLLRKVKSSCSVSESRPSGLITYRDCKQLLSDNDYIAKIDTRFQCILLRLFPVCSVILRDSVLVVANGNMNIDGFIKELCDITRQYNARNSEPRATDLPQKIAPDEPEYTSDSSLPFEIKVLECCYSAALAHLENEMASSEEKFRLVEQMISDKHKYENVNIILHELKQPVKSMAEILTGFSRMMDDRLSDKDSLKLLEFENHAYFYGSESPNLLFDERPVNRDLENLIEYFDQEVDQMARRSRTLATSLDELEKHLTVVLAIIRNEMMRFEIICSIFSTAFGAGACLTGLFGMNVVNRLEDSHGAFITVSIVTLSMFLCALFLTRVLIYRHRV